MSAQRPEPPRQDNGLRASAYVPLTDVEPEIGQLLLTALGRARIAAYLASHEPNPAADAGERRRLFVASEERTDARTIVAAAVRALGEPAPALDESPAVRPDPLDGVDTDTAFDALIADWHVDTHAAIREAERDLRREDEQWRARLSRPPAEDPIWLDDDHYVPPPPPPLPRLTGPTIVAMVVMAAAIVVLAIGGRFGLGGELGFVLGMVGLLVGAGMLLTRVANTHRDEDDDGAAI